MSLRLAMAWVLVTLAAWPARAQVPFHRDLLPTHTALERVGLERQWHNTIPLGLGNERVIMLTTAASSQVVTGKVDLEGVTAAGFAGDTSLTPIDGLFKGWRLKFLDGPLKDQYRVIASYSGIERRFTFTTPFPSAPEADTPFAILDTLVFAQTNAGNFHAFEGETGQLLWTAKLGGPMTRAFPASVNSRAVFVTNTDVLIAIDRTSGRDLWRKKLEIFPSSPTACDEDLVTIGLENGRIEAFHLTIGNVNFKSSLKSFPVPGRTVASGEDVERLQDLAYLREPLQAWIHRTDGRMVSRPILARPVVAFGAQDGRVYVALHDEKTQLFRFPTGGAIVAPLASYGVRTLLASSMDRNVYAIDLFTGESKWTFASGAPVDQEPLVAGQEIFVQNARGQLSVLNPETGEARWTTETGGGKLVSVGQTKLYLKSINNDLFVVDRKSGRILDDPRTTSQVKGLNLREFTLGQTNQINDRIYLATPSGSVICLREMGRLSPTPLRDPAEKPFGYIPPGGYPEDDPNNQGAEPALDPGAEPESGIPQM